MSSGSMAEMMGADFAAGPPVKGPFKAPPSSAGGSGIVDDTHLFAAITEASPLVGWPA